MFEHAFTTHVGSVRELLLLILFTRWYQVPGTVVVAFLLCLNVIYHSLLGSTR